MIFNSSSTSTDTSNGGYLGIALLDSPPKNTEFTTLADHLSSTPASFSLDTDPVLHYDLLDSVLKVVEGGSSLLPLPYSLRAGVGTTNNEGTTTTTTTTTRLSEGPLSLLETEGIRCQAKVASSRLFLWFPDFEFGYAVPYPCITLHGIASPNSIYLQISPGTGGSGNGGGDDGTQFAELYLVASAATYNSSVSKDIYDALCTCAGLHADPDDSSDDEGNNGGIALDMDIDMDMGLEDENANGDDDGWTSSLIGHKSGDDCNDCNGDIEEESGNNGLRGSGDDGGTAGLEITIDDDDAVHAGMRRRRSQNLDDDADEPSQTGDVNSASNGEGNPEKWRRTS